MEACYVWLRVSLSSSQVPMSAYVIRVRIDRKSEKTYMHYFVRRNFPLTDHRQIRRRGIKTPASIHDADAIIRGTLDPSRHRRKALLMVRGARTSGVIPGILIVRPFVV